MEFGLNFYLRFIFVILTITYTSAILLIPSNEKLHVLMAKSANKFTDHFFQVLSIQTPSKNIVCSPLSIYTMLTAISHGAEGDTKKELIAVNVLENTLNSTLGFRFLLPLLYHYERTCKLNLINQFSVDKKLTFNPKFVRPALSDYDLDLHRLDFNKPEEVTKEINNGCKERTYGNYDDFVNPDDLNGIKTILVSGLYLSGEWAITFPLAATEKATFNITKSETTMVNMMHVSSEFNNGRVPGLNASYIEMRFNVLKLWNRPSGISMFIIRPDSFEDLDHVMKNIKHVNVTKLDKEPELTNVRLPKFKINSKFDLKSSLNQMGINKMFDDSTELDNIVRNASLKIGKFIHKLSFEVHETGVNENILSKLSQPTTLGKHPTFHVDIPFICIVFDKDAKTKLLMARIMNPNEI